MGNLPYVVASTTSHSVRDQSTNDDALLARILAGFLTHSDLALRR